MSSRLKPVYTICRLYETFFKTRPFVCSGFELFRERRALDLTGGSSVRLGNGKFVSEYKPRPYTTCDEASGQKK
jgi:hypothetical protein